MVKRRGTDQVQAWLSHDPNDKPVDEDYEYSQKTNAKVVSKIDELLTAAETNRLWTRLAIEPQTAAHTRCTSS